MIRLHDYEKLKYQTYSHRMKQNLNETRNLSPVVAKTLAFRKPSA